jgi:exopolysaccharide biosynthesis polyprenyl glycosylphosphotransferase
MLAAHHTYERRLPVGDVGRPVVRAGLGVAFVGLLMAATRVPIGPGEVTAFVVVSSAATTVRRAVGTALRAHSPAKATRVVVVGHGHGVRRMLAELSTSGSCFTAVAVCLTGTSRPDEFDVPVSHGLRGLRSCVAGSEADAVVVVPCRHVHPARVRRLGWELEGTGTHLFVATGLLELGRTRATLESSGSLPLVHVRQAELRGPRRLAKQVWERAAAGLALLVLAPLLLVLAALVRLESDGPALFRQTRVGRDGRTFTMLKLRTMCADAERRRAALVPLADDETLLFKLREDPRITRIGRFLRRYSLDELPQLVNVVRGEMALVGPRPPLPDEVDRYDDDTRRRLAVTPGLTGLWQVSGRSDLSWEESVRLDLRYVENWSLGLDATILARTVRAVLGHRGAY